MDFRNHHSNKRFFLMKQMNDYKKKVSKDNERKQNEVSQKDLTLDEWKAWKQDNDRMMEAKESDTNETLTQIKYEEWRLEEERKEKERLEKEKIAREIEAKKKAEEAKREQERIRIEKMEERKKQIALKRLEEQREKERVEKERALMDKEDKETKDKIRQEKEIIRKEKYEAHKKLMAKKKEAMEVERARANHERQLMTEEDNTGKAIARKEKERIWRIKKEEWRKQKAIEHRERMKKQHELMVKHREEKRLRKRQKVSFQLNSFTGSVPKPVASVVPEPQYVQILENNIEDINMNMKTRKKIYSIIPLNIFQTWHSLDLPEKMKNNITTLKNQHPEFKYHLYDDNMCRDFIQEHFDDDVLYSFDKLKPGAYKADLWRYCVLYIHGGIYLDIKYKCANGFNLIELTDKEYYVIDRPQTIGGIYQALLVNLPRNKLLYEAIYKIVEYCKNNTYTKITPLCVTGPGLLYELMDYDTYSCLKLKNIGDIITRNDKNILIYYPEYRSEQRKTQKTQYYDMMWRTKNIYNYPVLKSKKTYDFTQELDKLIGNRNIHLFSGTCSIVEIMNDKFILNLRWINYSYNKDGSKKHIPKEWISLNSRFVVDKEFTQLSEEQFLMNSFEQNSLFYSLEDIRLFRFKNIVYFIATKCDNNRQVPSMCSGIYEDLDKTQKDRHFNDIDFQLTSQIILPNNYDTDKIKIPEKNWSLFDYNDELCIIYNWFPLQIGKIDYESNLMNIIEIKYDIPQCFKDTRGSTCGYKFNDEIWFVVHKAQSYMKKFFNYQHYFVIFDLNMNLLRYSELFKIEGEKVEFCIGLVLKKGNLILSYSILDTISKVSIYNIDELNKNLKWYQHPRQS
jgi:mannosyltransferase OCH1-like enzyme